MPVLKHSGEACDPPKPQVDTVVFNFGVKPADTVTFDATSFSVDTSTAKPEPTLADLLACAGDESQPMTARLHAAERAASLLRADLERSCAALFPDFYWSSSKSDHPFWLEGDEPSMHFPQARRGSPDFDITPERDAALRALGFVYCEDQRLGLVGSNER